MVTVALGANTLRRYSDSGYKGRGAGVDIGEDAGVGSKKAATAIKVIECCRGLIRL